MTNISVTAITVTYHTGPRLHECLYALKSDADVSEIIIVDNGNPPVQQAWLDTFVERTPRAKLIRSDDNVGFGAAVNIGAASALGQKLLIINPDAVIRHNSIGPMIVAGEGRNSPCIVGGKIFDITGKEMRGGRRKTLTLAGALGLVRWNLNEDPPPSQPITVGAVSGAFFMIERADLRALGGFDETYFLHAEDLDLCRRAKIAGGDVIYQPAAAALHYTSTSDAPAGVVQAHKARSLSHYFRKFASGPVERAALTVLLPIMEWQVRRRA